MIHSLPDLCQARGLNLDQLSAQTGLERDRVEAICQGRWTPSPTEREKIATALGVGSDEIAWGHKTPIQHLYGHGPD